MPTTKFDWQKMIASENGPESPTTRHVLLTISLYMDETGGNCFPSTRTIATNTGLSERVVCRHLKIASDEGWIIKSPAGVNGQGWKRNSYESTIPQKALTQGQHLEAEGTDGKSAPLKKGTDFGAKGTDSGDIKALTQGQSNSHLIVNRSVSNNAPSFFLKDGSTFNIDDDFIHLLKTTYPLVDISAEIKKLSTWCHANPSKRKTRNGAKRFVNSWMSNAKPATKPVTPTNREFDFENQFHQD